MKFAFIHSERNTFPITMLCRVIQVARSGLRAWVVRGECDRVRQDRLLSGHVAATFERRMSRTRNPWANAVIKSSFSTLLAQASLMRLRRPHRSINIYRCREQLPVMALRTDNDWVWTAKATSGWLRDIFDLTGALDMHAANSRATPP